MIEVPKRDVYDMRHLTCLLATLLTLSTGPVAADTSATWLQFRQALGGGGLQVQLAWQARGLEAANGRAPYLVLPLFRHQSGLLRAPLNAAADDKPFCERSLTGCIAFSALIGVGIIYMVEEFADESRKNDTRVTVISAPGQ